LEERLLILSNEKINDDIKKLCSKINSDSFKKETIRLKELLKNDKNNLEALISYNNLLKKAKL
jgi:hypothetical protein